MFATLLATVTERGVLLELYNATYGKHWIDHKHWNTSKDICEWYGITCNRNGNITAVNLPSNNLTGYIPNEISSLLFLQYLNIENNSLSTEFPDTFCEMHELLQFNASYAGIYGEMPTCICNLEFLEVFNVSNNLINNTIPSCIGNMSFMQIMDLQCNKLVGIVPESVKDFMYIEELLLGCNDLTCNYTVRPGAKTSCDSASCNCKTVKAVCPAIEYISTCGIYERENDCPVRIDDVCE